MRQVPSYYFRPFFASFLPQLEVEISLARLRQMPIHGSISVISHSPDISNLASRSVCTQAGFRRTIPFLALTKLGHCAWPLTLMRRFRHSLQPLLRGTPTMTDKVGKDEVQRKALHAQIVSRLRAKKPLPAITLR